MSVRRVSGVAALVLGLAPCHAAEPAFDQALSGGKPDLSLRVRAENVRDDAFARDATAPTFRLRLGYETLPWHHATALLEVDHLGLWGGDAYNSTRNGRTDRPIVADPEVREHPANLPNDLEARLAKIDLAESSRNRDRIIDEWSRRYSAKAEAKP